MKTTSALACLVLGLALPALVTAAAPPTYPCYQLTGEPVLDGRLDDACWRGLPEATGFCLLGSAALARERQTSFRMGWTADSLYLAFRCNEPMPDKVKAPTSDGDAIWGGDTVECFLCPGPATEYLQLVTNGAGARWNARGPNLLDRDIWAWQAKAAIDNVFWSLEIRIPFAVLHKTPVAGEEWRFNLGRSVRVEGATEKNTCWVPSSGFNEVGKFAGLVFKAGTPAEPERLAVETAMRAAYVEFMSKQAEELDRQLTEISRTVAAYADLLNRSTGNPKLRKDVAQLKETLDGIAQLTAIKDADLAGKVAAIAKYRDAKLDEKLDEIKYRVLLEELFGPVATK
ncbi:MAG: hypothetical protein A3K19_01835 [Lentisphaerae bacterium RIFOXYB12_FULL_65_16]|nr:MAG: hypothetical protein A3K18_02480 [Lentisphaerae bacterium RIFOXYA12_64_32]OGV92726.1 MAG: hypothetical protein A3K19_01835 [Lentisphaerae bacterium RIFOXYB12_FULL_65_16]